MAANADQGARVKKIGVPASVDGPKVVLSKGALCVLAATASVEAFCLETACHGMALC